MASALLPISGSAVTPALTLPLLSMLLLELWLALTFSTMVYMLPLSVSMALTILTG